MNHQIAAVIGTRPEAIKLASVVRALAERSIPPLLIFTGQHPSLEPADHNLDGFDNLRLSCPGQIDPHAHVGLVSKAIIEALAAAPPELLIVQGDTSSALGGALAARIAGLPLAHVEAGLRSHDLKRPWPEEEFRIAIDRDCELLFAPTELSAANLRRERVRGRIHVTGNSGIDAVLAFRSVPADGRRRRVPKLLVTCHRRENWGRGVRSLAEALQAVASQGIASIELILHPNPALAAVMRQMLAGQDAIAFRQPCGHRETIAAMLEADLVLSDSGGIQEEATTLGIPLLVLRERTERPEAIACGNVELVGTAPDRIAGTVRRRLNGAARAAPARPFGDGRAGERIAAIVGDWLEEKALSPVCALAGQARRNW